MDEREWLAERFEEHSTRLRAVAYRMLGSLSEDRLLERSRRDSIVRSITLTPPQAQERLTHDSN
jgi:hypothetical protein